MTDDPIADDADIAEDVNCAADRMSLAERFSELAMLGKELLAAESRIESLVRHNVELKRTIVRLTKQASLADALPVDTARPAAVQKQVRALEQDVAGLTAAVSEKERARFELQEEAWALSEAFSAHLELGPDAEAVPALPDYVQEVVKLSHLLRKAEAELRSSDQQVADLMLESKTSQSSGPARGLDWTGGMAGLTELRAQMTQLVADRDRAILRAKDHA